MTDAGAGTQVSNIASAKPTWLSRSAGVLDNELLPLLLASLSIGWLAWRIFFYFSPRLWARQAPVDMSTITSWAVPFMRDRDGAEPQALLALAVGSTALVCALAYGLRRGGRWVRAAVSLLGVIGALSLAQSADFVIPMLDIGRSEKNVYWVVLAALAASVVLGWGLRHGRTISVAAAVVLVPIVFLPTGESSPEDAATILAPALRLLHGVPSAHVYLQYDYLPSLLAEGWLWFGGPPSGFFFLTSATYYACAVALFVLARRWLAHPGLAGPLLVTVVLVRMYAVIADVAAFPQVCPLRLDLWVVPVAIALRFGVRHWLIAVSLGLMCIFSRSIGLLFLGGYFLALGLDFLGAYWGQPPAKRGPFRSELADFLRKVGPSVLIIALCLGIEVAWFGSLVSDAVLVYRNLGVGQMKITAHSFYWWLLPLTALTGGLAFRKRAELGEARGGAALLLVGLSISSSIYFFGRSHENNLLNLSIPFLTCWFLSLDLALLELPPGSKLAQPIQILISSALVATLSWQYSGRIWQKAAVQVAVISRADKIPPLLPGQGLDRSYCGEVARQTGDTKIYFFSVSDFWAYDECGYVPPSYTQPVALAALKQTLIDEMSQLLDRGYTIAVPKADIMHTPFNRDFLPALPRQGELVSGESPHYQFTRRGTPFTPQAPPPPRRRRGAADAAD